MRWLKLCMPMAATYGVACIAALLGGARSPAAVFGLPLVFVSGWVFVGHLITLDDDASGGWSNPDRSIGLWRRSLFELVVKGIVFGVIAWAVIKLLG
jgi:hypothetical protein